jgi:hypothetical protein
VQCTIVLARQDVGFSLSFYYYLSGKWIADPTLIIKKLKSDKSNCSKRAKSKDLLRFAR